MTVIWWESLQWDKCIFKEGGRRCLGNIWKILWSVDRHVWKKKFRHSSARIETQPLQNKSEILTMQRVKAMWQLVMMVTCLNIIFCIVDESGFSAPPGSASKRTFNGIKGDIMICWLNESYSPEAGFPDGFRNRTIVPKERKALSNSNGRNCLKCLLKSSCYSNPGKPI